MSGSYIFLDAGALENLFTAGGTRAWDALLAGGRKLVIVDGVLDEIAGIKEYLDDAQTLRNPNYNLRRTFDNWLSGKSNIVRIDGFRPPPVPGSSATDHAITRLMSGADDQVRAELAAAGIPSGTKFELLTDDRNWLARLSRDSNGFRRAGVSALGLRDEPYAGTFSFLHTQRFRGYLSDAEVDQMVETFRRSHRHVHPVGSRLGILQQAAAEQVLSNGKKGGSLNATGFGTVTDLAVAAANDNVSARLAA